MTPTIHPAGPTARVITLPTTQDRFIVPAPPLTADTAYLVTTVTVTQGQQGPEVSLQGETPSGEFIDLTDLYTSTDAAGLVYAYAPLTTQQALERAVTELRHPAGKAPGPHAERDALLQATSPGIVTSLDSYRRSHGR